MNFRILIKKKNRKNSAASFGFLVKGLESPDDIYIGR